MTKVTMAQALNTALRDALREDERVLVFGEDVGPLGGVFRITDGLTRDFGEQRCFDTPLAEAGIVGLAVGMAMGGFRPVVEMQFDAFAYPAFEQIASHVAKLRNRTRGRLTLPMVIRIPYAGGIGGVEHHCDSSEAYYAHTPGLKVVTPATAEDAYWLLRDAVADPDPVVFLEPKKLYWSRRTPTWSGAVRCRSAGRRSGGRAVTPRSSRTGRRFRWRWPRPKPRRPGIELEVVDLRTVVPFDDETVTASVRRTGRCLVVQEAQGFAGVGAEIAARVQERCFHSLAAPVLRVSGFDIPYPPPKLEHAHLPGVDRILDAVDRLQLADEPDTRHLPKGAVA